MLTLCPPRRIAIPLSMGALLLGTGCAATAERHTYVVSAAEVPNLLRQRDTLHVLDVRPAEDYAFGHVPGAVSVDPDRWKTLSLTEDTGLNQRDYWHREFGELGISGRETILIYDDGRMTEAARLWFILQLYGAHEVKILNGGYPTLAEQIAHGRLELRSGATAPTPTTFDPSPSEHPPVRLVERAGVKSAVTGLTAQIFDARSAAEFAGNDLRKNARGGHLPGARHIAHTELLDARNCLRPPSELRQRLTAAGFEPGRPLITHCDGGGRASLAALAAVEAGFGPVENYYLSFGDWAGDLSCPVVVPDPPASAAE